jgi:hypothetical protein
MERQPYAKITDFSGNPIELSRSDLAQISIGNKALYAYGYLEYMDDVSTDRGTEILRFCGRFNKTYSQAPYLNQHGAPLPFCTQPSYIGLRDQPKK